MRGTLYPTPVPFLDDEDEKRNVLGLGTRWAQLGARHGAANERTAAISGALRNGSGLSGASPYQILSPSFSENSSPHPNHGGSFFYCDPEIVTHPHRKFR
jgi:hypothetical protein